MDRRVSVHDLETAIESAGHRGTVEEGLNGTAWRTFLNDVVGSWPVWEELDPKPSLQDVLHPLLAAGYLVTLGSGETPETTSGAVRPTYPVDDPHAFLTYEHRSGKVTVSPTADASWRDAEKVRVLMPDGVWSSD